LSDLILRPGRIAYAPEREPGEIGRTTDNARLRYVSPVEYYTTKLWHSFNIVQVLMEMAFVFGGETEEGEIVEDAVVEAYRVRHRCVLLPPRLVRQIAVLSPGKDGPRLVSWLEKWMETVSRADSYESALSAHAEARAEILNTAASSPIGHTVVATAEISADLLLLQRAIADDVEASEREREPGELRGSRLTEMDRYERLLFEKALDHILSPERLYESLPPEVQEVARRYASRRGDIDLRGVLAPSGF